MHKTSPQGNKRRVGGFKNPPPTWTHNYDENCFSGVYLQNPFNAWLYSNVGQSQRQSSSCVYIQYTGSKLLNLDPFQEELLMWKW